MNFSQFLLITLGLISVNVQSTHVEHRPHNNNHHHNNNNHLQHQQQLDTLASKLIASMGIENLPNYKNVSRFSRKIKYLSIPIIMTI